MYSACFTGHRKIRNSFYNTDNPTPEWRALKEYLFSVIGTFVDNNIHTFYTGMAIGVDTVAAEAVIAARISKGPIGLIAAIPFPSQPSKWPQASKDNYSRILSHCSSAVNVNEDPYTPWKMHARDRYMVDNSHYIIGIWDGRDGGGTYSTVKYGMESGKHVFIINPETYVGQWLKEIP